MPQGQLKEIKSEQKAGDIKDKRPRIKGSFDPNLARKKIDTLKDAIDAALINGKYSECLDFQYKLTDHLSKLDQYLRNKSKKQSQEIIRLCQTAQAATEQIEDFVKLAKIGADLQSPVYACFDNSYAELQQAFDRESKSLKAIFELRDQQFKPEICLHRIQTLKILINCEKISLVKKLFAQKTIVDNLEIYYLHCITSNIFDDAAGKILADLDKARKDLITLETRYKSECDRKLAAFFKAPKTSVKSVYLQPLTFSRLQHTPNAELVERQRAIREQKDREKKAETKISSALRPAVA